MMRNLFSLNKIYIFSEKTLTFIKSVFPVLLILGLTFALFYLHRTISGDSVRIMYVHVPSAWIALISFSTIAFLSIITFIFKIKILIFISKSIAPIGLMFTSLAIITGALWGQPTWGTWWVWDARITSMTVLLIFYIMLMLSYKLITKEEIAEKVSNIIAIIGMINIPIIKYSVDWWNTLHQPRSINLLERSSTIHTSML